MNAKEIVNATKKTKDKKAEDLIDDVCLFEKLPEDVQDAILELMRTMLHNK